MGIFRLLPAPLLIIVVAIIAISVVLYFIREYKRNDRVTRLSVYGIIFLMVPIPIIGLAVEGYLNVSNLLLNIIETVSFSLFGLGAILLSINAYNRGKTDEKIRKTFVFSMIMLGFGGFIFLMVFILYKWG